MRKSKVVYVTVGNIQKIKVVGEEEIEMKWFDSGKTITLNHVLYEPDIVANLIKITSRMKNNYKGKLW